MKTDVLPLGKLIDAITDNREKQRKLNDQLKVLKDEYDTLEETIKQRLDAEGMDKATGKKATVSISKVVVANVKDWDKFYALIKTSWLLSPASTASERACVPRAAGNER